MVVESNVDTTANDFEQSIDEMDWSMKKKKKRILKRETYGKLDTTELAFDLYCDIVED